MVMATVMVMSAIMLYVCDKDDDDDDDDCDLYTLNYDWYS